MGLWYKPWRNVPLIALFLTIVISDVAADYGKRRITLPRMKRGLNAEQMKMVLPRMRRSSYHPEEVDYNVANDGDYDESEYVLDPMPKRRYVRPIGLFQECPFLKR